MVERVNKISSVCGSSALQHQCHAREWLKGVIRLGERQQRDSLVTYEVTGPARGSNESE
jgi:hypothetical protein